MTMTPDEVVKVLEQVYNLHNHWNKSYDSNELPRLLGYIPPTDWLKSLSSAISLIQDYQKLREICICAAVIAENGDIYRGHRHCLDCANDRGYNQAKQEIRQRIERE